MSEQLPSVGRIVHYYRRVRDFDPHTRLRPTGSRVLGPYAALVVDVAEIGDGSDSVTLVWWGHNGRQTAEHMVAYDEEAAATALDRAWSWPPRV